MDLLRNNDAENSKTDKIETEMTTRKEGISIGFIGHVDAGKSTLCGNILIATGTIPVHEVQKLMKTASEDGFSHISGIVDITPEEREKGKTVECNRVHFKTESKIVTVIDTPGHKNLVANIIEGIAQANVVILVVSARKGEFENGFEEGETKEHLLLAKASVIEKIIILVNKMDTVSWDEERFNECRKTLTPFLRKLWRNENLTFIPCSAISGIGLTVEHGDVCSWYEGPTFVSFLDRVPCAKINAKDPFAMFVARVSKNKDHTVIEGKIESGKVGEEQKVFLMPDRTCATVCKLSLDNVAVKELFRGENGQIFLNKTDKGSDSKNISVVCDDFKIVLKGRSFLTELTIIPPTHSKKYENKIEKKKKIESETKNNRPPVITCGYSALMHVRYTSRKITITNMRDKETKKKMVFLKTNQTALATIECEYEICVLRGIYFVLRNANDANCRTVAAGKILKIME